MIKEIPVRPHVKQYLIRQFGAEPVPVHLNSPLGKLILCVVEKLPYRLDAHKAAPRYDCAIRIKMPTAIKHFALTEQSARAVGEFLEKYFQEQFRTFVSAQVMVTSNERRAITMFFDLYGLSETEDTGYDFESLRKCWRDYKDRILVNSEQVLVNRPSKTY